MNKKLAWILSPALLAVSMSASAYNIDLFTAFQSAGDSVLGEGNFATNATSTNTLDAGSIIGTERDIQVDCITNCVDQGTTGTHEIGDLGTTMVITGGALQFSNDASGIEGVTGTGLVQWDGTDNNIALDADGLGGIDLRGDGSSAFVFTVLNADLDFEFIIEAYTDDDEWTRVTIAATVDGGFPETRIIQFASLENALLCGQGPLGNGVLLIECGSGGNFNASNTGAFQVLLNTSDPGTAEVDLAIGSIRTIPEPTMLGLLGVALLAGGIARRGRRSKI